MDDQTRKIIENTPVDDFDGHTEFSRLTPDQRLSWLDEANATYLELHGLAQGTEEQTPYGTQD